MEACDTLNIIMKEDRIFRAGVADVWPSAFTPSDRLTLQFARL